MNDASVSRMNLWLVVALVVAIALLTAAVTFVTLQPILGHWIGGLLHGPAQMASYCGAVPTPC